MAEKAFSLEIVSPRKVIFTGEVTSFSAPGVSGGFQVLFNHAPLLAAIGVGVMKLRDTQGQESKYTTGGGFVDVLNNKVTMLAESAEKPLEIDVPRAEKAKERALQRLSERRPDLDVERAQAALARALNRLKATQK
jgi:F-type H+-transporting ATPase subunit epsilon